MRYAFLALCACSSAAAAEPNWPIPLEAYLDPIDRQIAETSKGIPGRSAPCARNEVTNGIKVIVSQPIDKCVKMLPAQEWRGLWRFSFEGSQFCPEPARTCDARTPGDKIELQRGPGTHGRGELYRVDFIGRRTAHGSIYGDHPLAQDIVVDRLISIKEIEPPPKD